MRLLPASAVSPGTPALITSQPVLRARAVGQSSPGAAPVPKVTLSPKASTVAPGVTGRQLGFLAAGQEHDGGEQGEDEKSVPHEEGRSEDRGDGMLGF
jgi:hypothetical protein